MEIKNSVNINTPKKESKGKAMDLKQVSKKNSSSNIVKFSNKNLADKKEDKENEKTNKPKPKRESELRDHLKKETDIKDKQLKELENKTLSKKDSDKKEDIRRNLETKENHLKKADKIIVQKEDPINKEFSFDKSEQKEKINEESEHKESHKKETDSKDTHKKESETKDKPNRFIENKINSKKESDNREKPNKLSENKEKLSKIIEEKGKSNKEKEMEKKENSNFVKEKDSTKTTKKNSSNITFKTSFTTLPIEKKTSKTPKAATEREPINEKKESKDSPLSLSKNIPNRKAREIPNLQSPKGKGKKTQEAYSSTDNIETLETEENEPSDSVQEIKELLMKNKKFVTEFYEKNEEFKHEMCAPQHPKFLIITCCDSRILTSKILGVNPGELFIHRNIGNIVLSTDFSLQTVLSYAVEQLKVKNIIILGHTDCGAIKAALSNNTVGLIEYWLQPMKEIIEKKRDLLEDINSNCPEKLESKFAELNVKEQVLNLTRNPIIQKTWKEGKNLFIHGMLLEIDSGNVKDLKVMKKERKQTKEIIPINHSSNLNLIMNN